MAGYRDKPDIPKLDDDTTGVIAARYGVGLFILGLVVLASGEVPGLKDVELLRRHHVIVACLMCLGGAGLFSIGWKHPE